MTLSDRFIPPAYLRHPFVQTVLCSSRLRAVGPNPMTACARETLLETEDGARLQGYWSHQTTRPPRGQVVLLHGWEGSAESTYMLSTGRFLFERGFDIFRLNYRDHGKTHHLNTGLFLGTLIDEVFAAVKTAADQSKGLPVFLAGFSIGGSFAIRVACRCKETPIKTLKRVVAVNPPLDPLKGTLRIDGLRLIKRYFINKWKRSLRIKQQLYPDLYDLEDVLDMRTCMEMTEALIRRYTDYKDAADYFSRYNLTRGYLEQTPLPVAVITAADDPVVPVEDFYTTPVNQNVDLIIHPQGGHCGFIDGLRMESWVEKWMAADFERLSETGL